MENNKNHPESGENFEQKVKHLEEEIQHEKAEIHHLEKELEELEHHHHKEVALLVNSTPKKWDKEEISYKEVVELAFPKHTHNPDVVYAVTYSKGPERKPSGTLADGDKVCVKDKMNFNVTPANRS